jgi:XTP/dITP diphosphohydrolase
MNLLIATTNPGKVRELRRVLGDSPLELEDLSSHPSIPVVEETGRTFSENACLKATYYAKALKRWTLADDSGLAVDALDGAPGPYSARWAEMHGCGSGDLANNQLLLEQLQSVPDQRRTARFVCTLALADPRGTIILTVTDTVEGRILHHARGAGGFGYDPLFFVESHGCTTAEMAPDVKNAISHRGKAMRRMVALMTENIDIPTGISSKKQP